jgi:hypothetical protein
MGDLVIPEAEHVFAQCDRYRIAKYLKQMLAHLNDIE